MNKSRLEVIINNNDYLNHKDSIKYGNYNYNKPNFINNGFNYDCSLAYVGMEIAMGIILRIIIRINITMIVVVIIIMTVL